jgi:hypothetical protein
MEFLETPAFTRYVSGYLTDDEYRELQKPAGGCTGKWSRYPRNRGFRKLRWADPRRGKGRRGGLRRIYYYFPGE